MTSFHTLSTIFLSLACLTCSADGFVAVHPNRGHDIIVKRPRDLGPAQMTILSSRTPRTPIRQRARDNKDGKGRASIARFAIKDENNDGNDAEEEKGGYTRVEDGSPLGVAVVLLGSLYIFGSGDESYREPTSDSVWIVAATASVAAGLARLFRWYTREKDE
mmetsp:Transcript_47274/g.100515  ORF Transcript_47274/g.100515 Transcript_47274/m.100515 type:complete len:162 (+) Transcript_47274:121-606(+)|eukprot:CAMPEP_0172545484 /NCGR_PEP_ID=MMETSP1067-20121228/15392_1 /TAXON_ID=265564 ORGANISM="Thalassiosira punctigera, Strain Tpunct2005C2" /NCGR_SAMPLE_ID=MMETSP1067 /ASSEMBLY_ACC=CAM_ASM_000444 /LENGTH=161 /DNA_ID=CAMNT_0013332227 /DNA_START=68 /DNA_END=553 /DNA_ORIENTATION=-